MSHKTDFSELSKQAGYCQCGRPTTRHPQLFSLLLAATKSLPSKSQHAWEIHGWIGTPTNVSKHCTSRVLGRTAFGSPKSNSSVTSSCASCGFLRSRLESQSWNSFNPFPIVNRVSADVPTPPDSGKTPQLKTSKLAQNCGKTEVLHL